MKPDPALLEGIVAQPKALEPRLALAEWYEKHGAAPRAELIRADVELRTRINPARRKALEKRTRELIAKHGDAWRAALPALKGIRPDLTRGIVEQVELSEKALAEHGEELLSHEPVHHLSLEVKDGKGLEKAASQPWFERLCWLKVREEGDKVARALAQAPHAGRLHTLMLRGMSKKGLSTLLGSESLSGVRVLSLTHGSSGERLGNEELEAFAEGRLQLERLLMSACMELEEPLTPLVEAEWLRPLKVLALNRNELTEEDAEVLAKSKVLENLEELELAGTDISAEGLLAFRSAKALPRLKRLDLRGMWFDREEIAPLRKRFGSGLKL